MFEIKISRGEIGKNTKSEPTQELFKKYIETQESQDYVGANIDRTIYRNTHTRVKSTMFVTFKKITCLMKSSVGL